MTSNEPRITFCASWKFDDMDGESFAFKEFGNIFAARGYAKEVIRHGLRYGRHRRVKIARCEVAEILDETAIQEGSEA